MTVNNVMIRVSGARECTLAKAVLMTVSVLLMVISSISLVDTGNVSNSWPQVVFWLFVFWLICYALCSYQMFKSAYLFTTGYILTLVLFHLGHIIPHALGMIDVPNLTAPGIARSYFKSGWLTMLALSALSLGFSLGIKRQRIVAVDSGAYNRKQVQARRLIWWHGIGLLLVSLAFFMLTVSIVGNIFAYSRAQIFGGIGDTRGFNMFLMLYPAGSVLLMVGASSKAENRIAAGFALLGFLAIMFLGYRSAVMFPALVGVIMWVKMGRKIPVYLVIGSLIAALVLIPMVRHLRALGAYENITAADIRASFDQADPVDIFAELGGTGGILAKVLELVPAEDDYRYGSTYVKALKGAIPNVGFTASESSRALVDGAMNKVEA